MDIIETFYKILSSNLSIGILSISLGLNIYLFKLYLNKNSKYERLLLDGNKMNKQMVLILQRLRIKDTSENKKLLSDGD